MNKQSPLAVSEPGVLTSPAYPEPGHRIQDDLRRRINLNEGYDLPQKQLRRMFGLQKSTLSNWLNHSENAAVQFLFGLLERLPEAERNAFAQKYCRTLPTFDHASLAHEPAVVEQLRALLSRPAALTLISGPSAHARHFLLSTLGHGFSRQDDEHRTIAGLICKSPGRLVPLDGVFYLAAEANPEIVLQRINRLWPQIRDADAPMVVLDGVWLRAPNKRTDILRLAASRHVVVADEFSDSRPPGVKASLLHRLEVSGSPETALKIQIRR
jgi:hypothetical protein